MVGVTFRAKHDPTPFCFFIVISIRWAASKVGSMFRAYSQWARLRTGCCPWRATEFGTRDAFAGASVVVPCRLADRLVANLGRSPGRAPGVPAVPRQGSDRSPAYGSHAMRSAFVAPGVPNGTPAVITTLSAVLAILSRLAMFTARWTISEKLETSRVWTQCAPQSSESRRAVFRFDVNTRIGTSGRSRAARSAVAPDVV